MYNNINININSEVIDLDNNLEEKNLDIEKLNNEKIDEQVNKKREIIHKFGIALAIFAIALTIYAFADGYFVDRSKFTNFLGMFGPFAPFIFLIVQIFFTVFPVNPSGVTNISVVMAYGPIIGFILNYIAIMIGSVINFHMGRKYGKRFIGLIFDEETIDKQVNWLNKDNKIEKMFTWVLIIPFLPDDISCMICGMTDFKFSRFLLITAVIKPWATALMLYIMINGYQALFKLIFM